MINMDKRMFGMYEFMYGYHFEATIMIISEVSVDQVNKELHPTKKYQFWQYLSKIFKDRSQTASS